MHLREGENEGKPQLLGDSNMRRRGKLINKICRGESKILFARSSIQFLR